MPLRTIGPSQFFLRKAIFFPGVRFAREDVPDPRPGCPDDVFFDLGARFLLEFRAKDWITEADLAADSFNERYIGVV
jgi:hypothetical protein